MVENTGVARYLAKKAALSNKEIAGTAATGVERYLAKQASLLAEETVETLTGVAKYLRNLG